MGYCFGAFMEERRMKLLKRAIQPTTPALCNAKSTKDF
jgi:hypothetical protein